MGNENQNRVKQINRMLLEIGYGNLAYRIEIDGIDRNFDEIACLLNDIAKKIDLSIYKNLHNKSSNLVLKTNDVANSIVLSVQDYILNHLEEPLPTTKELSKMLGTNEFTLKNSFRNIVKTSIYQFYNDERLKKAHFLIKETAIPLKEIALICGFNDYPNFYKAFKKRYNYPPSEFKREK